MDRDNNVDPDNMVKAKPRVSNIDDKELNAFRLWKEEKEQRVETRRKGSRKKSFSNSDMKYSNTCFSNKCKKFNSIFWNFLGTHKRKLHQLDRTK